MKTSKHAKYKAGDNILLGMPGLNISKPLTVIGIFHHMFTYDNYRMKYHTLRIDGATAGMLWVDTADNNTEIIKGW